MQSNTTLEVQVSRERVMADIIMERDTQILEMVAMVNRLQPMVQQLEQEKMDAQNQILELQRRLADYEPNA
jgi:hypothetical protein